MLARGSPEAARAEPDLTVEIAGSMLPPGELAAKCRAEMALVMPYRSITHSGQLELACDLGLTAVLPDVPTLRAQLSETAVQEHPRVWFPATALSDPAGFVGYLARASRIPGTLIENQHYFPQYRRQEHESLLRKYDAEYSLSFEYG